MESNEYADLERAATRAEAAPWVDFPPTPAWYPPATGLWAAAMTLVLAELEGLLGFAAVVALAALEGAFLGWYRRYRGTMPTGAPPAEMRTAAALFVVGLAAIVVGLMTLSFVFATWVPVVAALVAVTALVTWYERAYAAGAARTRARLA